MAEWIFRWVCPHRAFLHYQEDAREKRREAQVTFEQTGALLAMLMVTLARPAAYSLASGHLSRGGGP